MSGLDAGQANTSGKGVSFSCHACGCDLTAAIKDIGKAMPCGTCNATNQVPLPRIKVGGGKSSGDRENQRATKAEIITERKPVGGQVSSATPEAAAPRQPPTPAPAAKVHEAPEKLSTAAGNDSIAQQKDIETRRGTFLPAIAVFIVFVLVGWSSTRWGGSVFAALVAQFESGGQAVESARGKMDLQTQLDTLSGYWRSAELARETVEMDLKVSLVEMESRGMVDQAAVVRKAISMKEDIIKNTQDRYVALMIVVAQAYDDDPDGSIAEFEKYVQSERVQADPRQQAFVEKSIQALKEKPQDKAQLKVHFEKVFHT